MTTGVDEQRIAVAMEYFRLVDAADPAMTDLMTDDVQIYFPKFGVGHGKEAVGQAGQGMMSSLQRIEHDFDRMNIMVAGNHVVVEGFEGGIMADGTPWPVEGRSEGRYCNVFEFEDLKIKRVHIYVDPDFASKHEEQFLWPSTGMTSKAGV